MSTSSHRITGVKRVELISDSAELSRVLGSLVKDITQWVLVSKLDWKTNGFISTGEYIYIPSSKTGRKGTGDIIASVGDYVVYMNDGRRLIVFTPEIKERIARNDFSWAKSL